MSEIAEQLLAPHKSYPATPRNKRSRAKGIDKTALTLPEPRRARDRDHIRYVAKQPCLVCGRQPSDAHHLRFAQSRALGRKVSDEFTVPLCRGHHREVHRCGDEAAWWQKAGLDPVVSARVLWLNTHPMPATSEKITDSEQAAHVGAVGGDQSNSKRDRPLKSRRDLQNEANYSSGCPMTSLRQIAANRANARKSTGPATEAKADEIIYHPQFLHEHYGPGDMLEHSWLAPDREVGFAQPPCSLLIR